MKMEGKASSAFQPQLMFPGSARVKPGGPTSQCDAGLLAARGIQSLHLRVPVLLWDDEAGMGLWSNTGVPAAPAKFLALKLKLCSGLACLSLCGHLHAWPAHMSTYKKWTSCIWWAWMWAKALLCVAQLGQQLPWVTFLIVSQLQMPQWLYLHLWSTTEQLKIQQCPE